MKRLFAIAACTLFAACAQAPAPVSSSPAAADERATDGRATTSAEGDRAAAVAGINGFGMTLYGRLAEPGKNVFLSPPSIAAALGMAEAGARGDTAAEIARILGAGSPGVRREQGRLSRELALNGEGRQVSVANAVWLQSGFAVDPAYPVTLRDIFGAAPESVDFADAGGAARRINDWTARNTAGRVTELFSSDSFTPDTRLVLANAVYLNADWASPFRPGQTAPASFRGPRGSVAVPFLNGVRSLSYLDGDGFTAVALPYVGGELAMHIFLPDADSGLAIFERMLAGGGLQRAMKALDAAPVATLALALPKLKLEATYKLVAPLKALGMVRAFADGADFTGITRAERLRIDEAMHKTFLQVDEKGTEAAAVTSLEIIATSARAPPPLSFRADRPFFFVIRDGRSGTALFIGRIVDPR